MYRLYRWFPVAKGIWRSVCRVPDYGTGLVGGLSEDVRLSGRG